MLIKIKIQANGEFDRMSGRLAAGGNSQPDGTFGATYAPTVDATSTKLVIAAFYADAVKQRYTEQLKLSSFDIPAAFLNIPLDKKACPQQLVMCIQKDLPHPLAECWVELLRALYGLKQSNNLFERDIRKQMVTAKFHACPSDPCVYIKYHPLDKKLKCIVCIHVDDGQVICNCPELYTDLITVLETKYGAIEKHDTSASFLGQTIVIDEIGSVTFGLEGYIRKFCVKAGINPLERCEIPSDEELFLEPKDKAPYDIKNYQRLIGGLIYTLTVRHDIHKEVIYLASKTAYPTGSDYLKVRQVIVYLQTTIYDGPTFYTEEGPVLYGHGDSSYGCHINGRSQSGYYCTIGMTSAPVCCYTGMQNDCVSTSAMQAEYVCLSDLAKKTEWLRFLLDDVGFTQREPTVLFQDNETAIKLSIAPQIPRRSRHIHIEHHFIRDMCEAKRAKVVHVRTEKLVADLLTKPLTATKFKPFKYSLLNMNYHKRYKK